MNNDLANEIRRKVDIVDIIGERIPLVSRGENFFGVCPFHDDSNPSMCVSREKQIYTCFVCGESGNVFNFVMNYEKIYHAAHFFVSGITWSVSHDAYK